MRTSGTGCAAANGLRAEMPSPPALDGIAEGFGLSDFERDMLLLCAGVELDTAVASACAERPR